MNKTNWSIKPFDSVILVTFFAVGTSCAADPDPCLYTECDPSNEPDKTSALDDSGVLISEDGRSPSQNSNDRSAGGQRERDGFTESETSDLEYNRLYGVSLAGADFGERSLPGKYGVDYIYPTTQEVDYFVKKGMNIFRIPFRWERLQQALMDDFDSDEQIRLSEVVDYIIDKGAWVILDPHNYARYNNDIIGEGTDVEAFADFWRRLALLFTHPRVVFGLVNEPHSMKTELWLKDANAAISAIRQTGASNLILVPGNAWSGAHSWQQDWYGTSNSEVMLDISDPADNLAFEVHQYLDGDSSGTAFDCVSPSIGSERLTGFTGWLRTHGFRGFLGEFGGGENQTCFEAVEDMLTHVENNQDVWIGWTYWAAGPWWGAYEFSIEPQNGQDAPMMDVLEPFL